MSSDDNDKSTERVLEYYQKYSQNKNLPKYFSGTSVSYLPPIEVDSDDNSKYTLKSSPEIPKITITEAVKYVEKDLLLVNSSPNASSSEGPSDHKKLEWDNGADIGYHSARTNPKKKLRKSASLPIIIDKVISDQIGALPKEKPSTVITHHGSNENIDLILYSSDSSTRSELECKKGQISSSTTPGVVETPKSLSSDSSSPSEPPKSKASTHSDSDISKFVEFQSSIDFLKRKIGLPGAQSTPNFIQLQLGKITSSQTSLAALLSRRHSSETSSTSGKAAGQLHSKVSNSSMMQKPSDESSDITKKSSSISSKLQTKNSKKSYQTKFVELSISTPINVNCKGPTVCSKDKILQTENAVTPKAVQTENITPESDKSTKRNKKDQEAQYSLYGEMADLASSFEYINVIEHENVKKSSQEEELYYTPSASKQCTTSKKLTSISGVLKEVTLSSTAESSSLSKSCSADIVKQIEKLHRLIKTKKGGHSAKKKLMKLIGDMDTSVDSSTSSDFFIPKKDKGVHQKLKAKVVFKDADNLISAYKERKLSQASISSEHKQKISESKFQSRSESSNSKPESSELLKIIERSQGSSEQIEDLKTDGQVSSHIVARKSSKIFDRSNGDGLHVSDIDEHAKYRNNQIIQTFTTQSNKAVSPAINSSNATSKENTASSLGGSHSQASLSKKTSEDYLLRFAENERNYQLNWINNEISHLSKLKSILELKSGTSLGTSAGPSQPQTKSYNVIRKDPASKKSSERNYVIQTQVQSRSQQPMNYRLEGKEYVVSDSKSSSASDRAIVADIEVSSDERNTNIKVRTFCSVCKHSICVCSPSKKTINSKLSSLKSESGGKKESLEEDSNSKGKILSLSQEMRPCKNCTKPICLCPKDNSEGSSSSQNSSDTPVFLECASDTEDTVSDEYINSLQKAFKDCCCTVKNANCGCDFVKKLLKKFQEQHKHKDHEEVQAAVSTEAKKLTSVNSLSRKTNIDISIPPVENIKFQTQTEPLNLAMQVQTDPSEDTAVETDKTSQRNCLTQMASTQGHQQIQTAQKVLKESAVQVKSNLSQQTKIQVSILPVSQKVKQLQTSEPQIRDQAAEARESLRDSPCQVNSFKDFQGDQKMQTVDRMLSEATAQAHTESVDAASQIGIEPPVSEETCLNVEDLQPVESLLAGKALHPSKATMTEVGVANVATSKNDLERRNIGVQVFPSFESSASQSLPIETQDRMLGEFSTTQLKQSKDKGAEAKEESKEIGVQYEGVNGPSPSRSSNGITLSTNTTTSTSDSRSSNCARITCCSCKQKAFLAEVSYFQEGDECLAVCSRCYYQKARNHSAQSSINQYCHCWDHWMSRKRDGSMHCRCCRVEVYKCPKRPQGLAYTVTLEEKKRHKSSKTSSVDNIKVQKGWSRKSLKNKENYNKKGGEKRNGLQEGDDEKEKDEQEIERERKRSKKRSSNQNGDSHYTLMEYLIRNRPEFVYSAEYRRQMLLHSRILREQQKDGAKLEFLDNNVKDNDRDQFRLFTAKEMKEINKKNYQKLPEVQDKLWNQRENKLRTADRLITNMFAKKVQKSILKGKGNHPIDRPLTIL